MTAPTTAPTICPTTANTACVAIDLAGQQQADRDRGVDVAAGHRADDVGHDEQRQTERQGDAQLADVLAGQDGRTGPADHEHRGAEQLGGEDATVVLFHGRNHILNRTSARGCGRRSSGAAGRLGSGPALDVVCLDQIDRRVVAGHDPQLGDLRAIAGVDRSAGNVVSGSNVSISPNTLLGSRTYWMSSLSFVYWAPRGEPVMMTRAD